MSGHDGFRFSPELARKWHALAVRRRDHYAELFQSGRWRRYFSEEGFVLLMREAVASVECWGALAVPERRKGERPSFQPLRVQGVRGDQAARAHPQPAAPATGDALLPDLPETESDAADAAAALEQDRLAEPMLAAALAKGALAADQAGSRTAA